MPRRARVRRDGRASGGDRRARPELVHGIPLITGGGLALALSIARAPLLGTGTGPATLLSGPTLLLLGLIALLGGIATVRTPWDPEAPPPAEGSRPPVPDPGRASWAGSGGPPTNGPAAKARESACRLCGDPVRGTDGPTGAEDPLGRFCPECRQLERLLAGTAG